jgi:hypothetical protein
MKKQMHPKGKNEIVYNRFEASLNISENI